MNQRQTRQCHDFTNLEEKGILLLIYLSAKGHISWFPQISNYSFINVYKAPHAFMVWKQRGRGWHQTWGGAVIKAQALITGWPPVCLTIR